MSGRWRAADLADHLGVDADAAPSPSAHARRSGTPRHSSGLRAVEPQRELPPYIVALLEEEPSDKGEGRSGQAFMLVKASLAAGFSVEEILWLAERHDPSVDKYEGRLDLEVERIIDKLRRLHDHVGLDCREADCENTPGWLLVSEPIARIRALMDSADWSYPGGDTDLMVLKAIVDLAETCGKTTVSASTRDLAKKVNRNKNTITRSLQRLRGDGGDRTRWIVEVRKGGVRWVSRPDDASTFALVTCRRTGTPKPQEKRRGEGVPVLPAHDVWTHGALNPSGFKVSDALQRYGPTSRPKLVDHFAGPPQVLSADTVRRALERLELHGLAQCDDAGLWSYLERDLDEVAAEIHVRSGGKSRPVKGRGARRAYRYSQDQRSRQKVLKLLKIVPPRERDAKKPATRNPAN